MTPINTIYSEMGIRETVLSFGNTIEKDLKKRFEKPLCARFLFLSERHAAYGTEICARIY